jgi:hypothetical protein
VVASRALCSGQYGMVNKLEKPVWDEFSGDPARLHTVAEAIRDAAIKCRRHSVPP